MENNYILAQDILKKYGQEQLLYSYNKLNSEQQKNLLKDILNTDFEQINTLFKNNMNKKSNLNSKIEPIEYVDKEKLSVEQKQKIEKIGIKIIKNGEYAVVTMAGGQRNKIRT